MIALVFIILKLMFWITSWLIIIGLKLLIIPFKLIWYLTFGWMGVFRKRKQSRPANYTDGFLTAMIISDMINH